MHPAASVAAFVTPLAPCAARLTARRARPRHPPPRFGRPRPAGRPCAVNAPDAPTTDSEPRCDSKDLSLYSLRAMGDAAFTLMFYEILLYADVYAETAAFEECVETAASAAAAASASAGPLACFRPELGLAVGALLGVWTVAETLRARIADAAREARAIAAEWKPFLHSIDAILATERALPHTPFDHDIQAATLDEVDDMLLWMGDDVVDSGRGAELLTRMAASPRDEVRARVAEHLNTLDGQSNVAEGLRVRLMNDRDPLVAAVARGEQADGSMAELLSYEEVIGSKSPLEEVKEKDLQALCVCAALSMLLELLSSVQDGLSFGELHFVGLGWLLSVAGAAVYPASRRAVGALPITHESRRP